MSPGTDQEKMNTRGRGTGISDQTATIVYSISAPGQRSLFVYISMQLRRASWFLRTRVLKNYLRLWSCKLYLDYSTLLVIDTCFLNVFLCFMFLTMHLKMFVKQILPRKLQIPYSNVFWRCNCSWTRGSNYKPIMIFCSIYITPKMDHKSGTKIFIH